MNFIFLGAPGVGKGTQAKKFSLELNIPHISTGDILRAAKDSGTEIGNKAKAIMEAGKLVSDDIVNELVQEKLLSDSCKNGFILDGYPRTIHQAEFLEKILKENSMENAKAINIEVPENQLVQRLINRRQCNNCKYDFNLSFVKEAKCPKCGSENLFQRADDNKETVSSRLQTYNEQTAPLVSFYSERSLLKSVDGTKKIDEVQEAISALI